LNNDKRHNSLLVLSLLAIFTVFTIAMPSQSIFASGITIYSPYWMNYEKDLKSPYFKYCGIFDSCFGNDIRIFSFLPLTSKAQNNEDNNIGTKAQNNEDNNIGTKAQNNEDNNIGTKAQNNEDNNIGTRNTLSSTIPFQLPFP
jgi:hypothetical protein